MKPRQVTVSIETTTDVAIDVLRRAARGTAVLRDPIAHVLAVLEVDQIQVNVIQQPKAAKKLVRR